jgi:Ca2+-binding EF-hand superfamily protein
MVFSDAGRYDWVVSEASEAQYDDALTLAKSETDLPALTQQSAIADSFATFDVNADGGLQLEEFKAAAMSVLTPWTTAFVADAALITPVLSPSSTLSSIFDAADADGNGMVEVNEFPLNTSRSSPTGPSISFVYSWQDDSDGEIMTPENLQASLSRSLPPPLSLTTSLHRRSARSKAGSPCTLRTRNYA